MAPPESPTDDKILEREKAAQGHHHWVRLTTACNNRCQFCLDARPEAAFRHLDTELVRHEIVRGRRDGATRLILSGGEATLHPRFVEFIALGRRLGYREVQVITNGRRFAYPKFLTACLNAGLSEITCSIHGHDAWLHDQLVGVEGAFEQALAGISCALADGRPIVNIDVCLNRINVAYLPQLLDRFLALGIKEFDLLHLIPFGRAYESKDSLFYDVEEAMPSIRHALALSKRPDVHIWFNRFPPEYLEGYEHLIQDPAKLLDEVRGRHKSFRRLVADGTPLECRDEARCSHCALRGLCVALDELRERVRSRSVEFVRFEASQPPGALPAWLRGLNGWVKARTVEEAERAARHFRGSNVVLDLTSYEGLPTGEMGGKRCVRGCAATPRQLEALLAARIPVVAAYLNKELAGYLQERRAEGDSRLVLVGSNYYRMTDAKRLDPDLAQFFAQFRGEFQVERIPECLSGRPPRTEPLALDSHLLTAEGHIDVMEFTREYIGTEYYLKSRRCRACKRDGDCRGAHVNTVRAHGFRLLQPL